MIENEFLLFRQFILKDEALALVKKLDEGGIEAILGDNKAPFDVTFSGNTSMDKYDGKIERETLKVQTYSLQKPLMKLSMTCRMIIIYIHLLLMNYIRSLPDMMNGVR